MFPAQKAVSRLAVGSHSILIFHVEYHWLTTSSLVSSSLHILYKHPVYVSNWFISRYYNTDALCSSSFAQTKLSTTRPDQLTEVESLATEARTVKVIIRDLFVPEF